jgi:hypothetical protein
MKIGEKVMLREKTLLMTVVSGLLLSVSQAVATTVNISFEPGTLPYHAPHYVTTDYIEWGIIFSEDTTGLDGEYNSGSAENYIQGGIFHNMRRVDFVTAGIVTSVTVTLLDRNTNQQFHLLYAFDTSGHQVDVDSFNDGGLNTSPFTLTVSSAQGIATVLAYQEPQLGAQELWNFEYTVFPDKISGFKFHDFDGNGSRDGDEPGLEGWEIYLDSNDNGQYDGGELNSVTDINGYYEFTNLDPCTYVVAEILQDGWIQTFPGGVGTHTVGVDTNEAELNFGNYLLQPGDINGYKFHDLNGNGIHDVGEEGLKGWNIYLDLNSNGQLDPGEPKSRTDSSGYYEFLNLDPGTYTVSEVPQAGWTQTLPGWTGGRLFGSELVLGSESTNIVEIDPNNGVVINSFSVPQPTLALGLGGVALGPTSLFFANAVADEDGIRPVIWELDADTGSVLDYYEVNLATDYIPRSVAYLNGKVYMVINEIPYSPPTQTDIVVWDPTADLVVTTFVVSEVVGDGLAGDPINGVLLATSGLAGLEKVAMIDPATGVILREINHGIIPCILLAYVDGTIIRSRWSNPFTTYRIDPKTGVITDNYEITGVSTLDGLGGDGLMSEKYKVDIGYRPVTNLDFGNVLTNTCGVQGTKWNDINGDGIQDQNEPILEGWKIYLDMNENNFWDDGEPYDFTDLNGNYEFTDLTPGTYYIAEVNQTNWQQTFPASDGIHSVKLTAGRVIENINFGNRLIPGEIHGAKWRDIDRDGVWDNEEPGLEGWKIYLDENENSQWDNTEPCDITDSNGNYALLNVPVGTYVVAEVLQNSCIQTFPGGNGTHFIDVGIDEVVENVDFGNRLPPGEIQGIIFDDINGNGEFDIDEVRLEGWKIYIDLNHNRRFDVTEPNCITNSNGEYEFLDLTPGTYDIREISQCRWRQTFPILSGQKLIEEPSPRDLIFDPHRNLLYISTANGTLERYDLTAHELLSPFDVGTSLYGMDITLDGQWLYVTEDEIDNPNGLAFLHKVNLNNGNVTDLAYQKDSVTEGGSWDIKITPYEIALLTASFNGSGYVPLRQLDLLTDEISIRADAPGSMPQNAVSQDTMIYCGTDRSLFLLTEANSSNGPAFTYDCATDTWPQQLNMGFTHNAPFSINHDASWMAFHRWLHPVDIWTTDFVPITTVSAGNNGGLVFDTSRDILYIADIDRSSIVAIDTKLWLEVDYINVTGGLEHYRVFDNGITAVSDDGVFLAISTVLGVTLFRVDGTHVVDVGPGEIINNLDFGNQRNMAGDFDGDRDVDMVDLATLCEQWLLEKLSADIAPYCPDGIVNFLDWAIFANAWQSTISPLSPNWNEQCDIAPEGGDGIVDMDDLTVFVNQWLQLSACCTDIAPMPDGDGFVNFSDLAEFGGQWLEGF